MFEGLIAVSLAFCSAFPADDITTLDQLCKQEPQRIARMFEALNLDYPGLGKVKATVTAEDMPRACEALLAYYKNAETASWLRKGAIPTAGDGRNAAADAILRREFTNYTITATVPLREDGGLDWNYNGPNNDPDWGGGVNRHHWAGQLIGAYFNMGYPVYVETFDRYLRDWIMFNDYPGKKEQGGTWRGLETYWVFFDFALLASRVRICIMTSCISPRRPMAAIYWLIPEDTRIKTENGVATSRDQKATTSFSWTVPSSGTR